MSFWSIVEQSYGIKIRDSRPFHDVYKVRTENGVYCLKPYEFHAEDVQFIGRILGYLEERGFSRGPKVYPTVEQAAFMTHNGVFYMLTNWVKGDRPDFSKRMDYKKGIRTLAKFHAVAEGFPLEEVPAGRVRYSGLSSEVTEYKELLSSYTHTGHLVPLCEEALGRLQQAGSLEAIDTEAQLSAFTHGDYNYPNMIKDPHRKIHLIDFDNSSLHVRMKDLSHILHRNCLWDGTEMLRWIDYYHKHRSLSSGDRCLLHALLVAPYHVVRNIRIGGIRHAKRVIPSQARMQKYQRELSVLSGS
ncbi:phosphotransferase [Paenibacillus sp. HJGM_3]|uniref:phosphotransferase n=1 Tax=Paenibacillus sp. HJGM_3 TaxID=3379816 RepID=UPI00385E91E6